MKQLTVEEVLWYWPWSSAQEIAHFSGRSVSQVNRALRRLHQHGTITFIYCGRRKRPCRRWRLSSLGLADLSGPDGPFSGPVPWWLTEMGTWTLFQRMEQLELFYTVAPDIFRGAGAGWDMSNKELNLASWGFFRRGQLVEAWGTYEGGTTLHFCWIGMEVKAPAIRTKWVGRFDRLVWCEADSREHIFDPLEQPSPDLPDPSGYVVVGADMCAVILASQILPKEATTCTAWCWVDGQTARILDYEGRTYPKGRWVEDWGRPPDVGYPELVNDRAEALAVLCGRLRTRIFELVEEWYALRVADVARLCGESRSRVRGILHEFMAAELVVQVGRHFYLGPAGYRYAARRDRVSPAVPRARHAAYLNGNEVRHKHQLRHNLMVNATVVEEVAGGAKIYGGWRGVLELPNRTQLAPDALLIGVSAFGHVILRLEIERTARTPSRVRRKVIPWAIARDAGLVVPVGFVLDDAEIERLFIELGRDIPMLTTLLADLQLGPVEGQLTVWRYRGEPSPFESV